MGVKLGLSHWGINIGWGRSRIGCRDIFGLKGNQVIRKWRRLRNEKLYNLYSAPDVMRVTKSRIWWMKHMARIRDTRDAYRVLTGKPEGSRPFERPRHRWKDNIKMEFQVVGWRGMDHIDLVQDRDRWWALLNVVMNLQVPWNVRELLASQKGLCL